MCTLTVLLFAFKITFLVSFRPVISLTTCHVFFACCSLWALSTLLILPLMCRCFSCEFNSYRSCSFLVPACFIPYLSIGFFVQYSQSLKTQRRSSVFFEDIFLLNSHWLPLCFDSSLLLFQQIPFPLGSQNDFGLPLCIDVSSWLSCVSLYFLIMSFFR